MQFVKDVFHSFSMTDDIRYGLIIFGDDTVKVTYDDGDDDDYDVGELSPGFFCCCFFLFFSLLNNSELSTLKVSTHYSVGDMSLPLQHFAATNDSMCTGRKISYCSKLRGTLQQQIGSCVLDNFCKNLCQFSVMETKIIVAKFFQHRRGDLSLRSVAATCCCCRLVFSGLYKSQLKNCAAVYHNNTSNDQ